MPTLADILHDETDRVEELEEQAGDKLEEIRKDVAKIAIKHNDFRGILEEIAVRLENELSTITTQAAKDGLEFGRKKTKVDKA
jgi:hypothetical protein